MGWAVFYCCLLLRTRPYVFYLPAVWDNFRISTEKPIQSIKFNVKSRLVFLTKDRNAEIVSGGLNDHFGGCLMYWLFKLFFVRIYRTNIEYSHSWHRSQSTDFFEVSRKYLDFLVYQARKCRPQSQNQNNNWNCLTFFNRDL